MANKEIERKIAVIFATDVVGYSKSVEANEEQTINLLKLMRKCFGFPHTTLRGSSGITLLCFYKMVI